MGAIYRISFHLKLAARTKAHILKIWWKKTVLRRTNDELFAEDLSADGLSQDETEGIKQTVAEWERESEANRPILDPRRTMLMHSRPEEYACNALTAAAYRLKLIAAVKWAQERGITTFLADYYTPLGILALETLVDLKEHGDDFCVYAVRSTYLRQRRTYRAIKETSLELIYLAARADYSYTDPVTAMLTDVLPSAWTHCTEQGIWVAKSKIPPYLLKAWES